MKRLPKSLLLFYSTIAALFISISGFIAAARGESIVFQIIFIPVTILLIILFLQELRRFGTERNDRKVSASKIIFFGLLYLLLLFVGIRNVGKTKENNEQINNPTIDKVTESTGRNDGIIFEKKPEKEQKTSILIVDLKDGSVTVNIRSGPSTSSEILSKEKSGQEFEYLEEEDGWYKIILEDGSYGYIFQDYIKF